MRTTKICTLTVLLLVTAAVANAGDGVWTTTYPEGGNVIGQGMTLNTANGRLDVAPSWRGLYSSTDGAASWQSYSDSWPFDYTRIFGVVRGLDNALYAFGWEAGGLDVFRSDDDGATWYPADAGTSGDLLVLGFHPTVATTIYAGSQQGNLFQTTDGAVSWSQVGAGLPGEEIRAIEVDQGGKVYVGTVASGLFESTDGGANFTGINNNVVLTDVVDVVISPANALDVYVADNDPTTGNGIYKSTDGGASWTKLSPTLNFGGWNQTLLAFDPGDSSTFYAGSMGEVYKTTDFGATWSSATLSPGVMTSVVIVDPATPTTLYAGTTGDGVYKSTDSGATWSEANGGLVARNFPTTGPRSVHFDASTAGLVYAGSEMRGWRSLDNGATWSRMEAPDLTLGTLVTHPSDPGGVWGVSNGLWRSSDNGVTWSAGSNGAFCCLAESDVVVHPGDPSTVYVASTAHGVWKTTDGGTTWNLRNNGLGNTAVHALTIDPADGNVLYAGVPEWHGASGVWKTTDGGANWFQLGGGLADPMVPKHLVVHPLDSNLVYVGGDGSDSGIHKSTDGGNSWTKILDDKVTTIGIDPTDTSRVYAGTWNSTGFYRSVDGGMSWAVINDGLPARPGITSMAVDPADTRRIVLGTSGGAWEYTFNSPVTLTVTNSNDVGPGSLYDAMQQANQDGVPNVITFAPWLAGTSIGVGSGLPPLGEGGTTIDGDFGDDCIPDIEIWGDGGTPGALFAVYSDNNQINGFAITNGGGDGVVLGSGRYNAIECNYVGPDLSGTGGPGNAFGVKIVDGASDNSIEHNLIAFNHGYGVWMFDGLDDRYPDFAGPTADASGQFPVIDFSSVGGGGCGPFQSADGLTPTDGDGGPFLETFGARFTGLLSVDVAGDYTFDVTEPWDAARVLVDGFVVVDAEECCPPHDGTISLGSGDHSIEVDFLTRHGGAALRLEVTGPGSATLSNAGQPGLWGEFFHLPVPTVRNSITENDIFDNGSLGILLGGCGPKPNDAGDVDRGPNNLANYPEITGVTDHGDGTFTIEGTAPFAADVEIFAVVPDPSGYGEGIFLESTNGLADETWSILISLPPGHFAVTATATVDHSTSEFAPNLALVTHTVAVTSSADSGPGSLRDAIEQANSDSTSTEISIDPGLAGQTIHLFQPLPSLTEDATTIDADLGGDCVPDLELDGSLAGWGDGFQVQSDDNLIRGFVINRFPHTGIYIDQGTQNNVVQCNYVGTDMSGTVPAPNNAVGVLVYGTDHTIGPGNVVAYNREHGVSVDDWQPESYPDFEGLVPDYTGVFPVIDFQDDCTAFSSIDGITPTDGNGAPFAESFGARFTGSLNVDQSGDYYMELQNTDDRARMLLDGAVVLECDWCDPSATTYLDAGDHSIEIDYVEGCGNASLRLWIDGPGNASLTSGGGQPGLDGEFFHVRVPSERNTITQNSIFDNESLGIGFNCNGCALPNDPGDVDVGPNTMLNFPELDSFTDHGGGSFTVDGTAPPDSTVEVFGAAPDPTGHGEGKAYLGSTSADPSGNFSITTSLPAEFVSFTATATDAAGNTSEFSQNLAVKSPDEVNLGTSEGFQGDTIEVPVYVRDLASTPLGVDQPAGAKIQGFTFQVQFQPASSVQAANAYHSGATAGLSALFDTFVTTGDTITYVVSFDEAASLVPLALDGPGPGDEVARLVITIDPGAPPTPIQLTVLNGTALSNQAGTTTETEGAFLTFGHGSLNVRTRAATSLDARAQSSSEVRLRWSDPQAGETGFRVERSDDGGGSWFTLTTLGGDVTEHLDSGLPAATLFYYRVVATNGGADAPLSNTAWAETFPASASKVCVTQVSDDHSYTRFPYPAHNGTNWAYLFQERTQATDNEIFFQFLDAWGNPTGATVRLTDNDMISQYPTLRFNGTHFGAMWSEHMRGPDGEITSNTFFGLLDRNGQVLRRGVMPLANTVGFLNDDLEEAFDWDGGAWGHFVSGSFVPGSTNLSFQRLSEDGDLSAGPMQLSFTTGDEYDMSAVWNGGEYGVTWIHLENDAYEVLFRRFLADGSLPGDDAGPVVVHQSAPGEQAIYTSLVWNGAGWAVAWDVAPLNGSWPYAVHLRLLAADGTPLAGAQRLSPDEDPAFPGGGAAVDDEIPELVHLPGVGYVCYTTSYSYLSGSSEIGRLEADAAGNRVGGRTFVSDDDGAHSGYQKVASDGTDHLLAWNEHRQGSQELGGGVVAADGSVIAGPNDLSWSHSPGNSWFIDSGGLGGTAPVGDGFLNVVGDNQSGYRQLYARIYDGAGNPAAEYWPLSPRQVRGFAGIEGLGDTFAVAFKDSSNTIVFARYHADGAGALFGEVEVVYDTGGRNGVGLAFSGETYGIVYFDASNNVVLQRVDPGGGGVGGPVVIASGGRQGPLVQWTGAGWAILWWGFDNLAYYALVDGWGALAAGPVQAVSNPTAGARFDMAWTGDSLGLTWVEGTDLYFNVLDLAGTPLLADVLVKSTYFGPGFPQLYWKGDRFGVVRGGCAAGGSDEACIYEDEILPDGTVFANVRKHTNRGSPGFAAYNGTALGLQWSQLREAYFQTDACLADATPPSCPALNVDMGDDAVELLWNGVDDPESTIWRYNLYRDGTMIAELFPQTQGYADAGFRQDTVHTYEVRALNGAYQESQSCPVVTFSTATGDGNGDGTIDAADIFYLIQYLYAGGPAPLGDADANGDGNLDAGDVFFLINHVFDGGPPPVPLVPLATADVLTLRTVTAAAGTTVEVPVYVRDVSGTPLGSDAGEAIQGFAFRVDFPPAAVTAASFVQSGSTSGKTPVFPVVQTGSDHLIVLVNFAQASDPLGLRGDPPAPGDRVGHLELTLAAGLAAGTTVNLTLDGASALVNDSATVSESPAKGTLDVVHGAVKIVIPAIFSDGFESGDTTAWSQVVGK